MTDLRIVRDPDDTDEPGSDADEDPRAAIADFGHGPDTPKGVTAAVTLEPRGPRRSGAPTHWAIVERDGNAPAGSATVGKVCRKCNEPAGILHQHPQQPNSPERTICGRCQGDVRRAML